MITGLPYRNNFNRAKTVRVRARSSWTSPSAGTMKQRRDRLNGITGDGYCGNMIYFNSMKYVKQLVGAILFLLLLTLYGVPQSFAASGYATISSNQVGDTVTINGEVRGDGCVVKPQLESIMVETIGATPDGQQHLDLSGAVISVRKNNTPIEGTVRHRSPISGVQQVALDVTQSGAVGTNDVFKITVSGAKAKAIGRFAIEVAVAQKDLMSMQCKWSSGENGKNYFIVAKTVVQPTVAQKLSPTTSFGPTQTVTESPAVNRTGGDVNPEGTITPDVKPKQPTNLILRVWFWVVDVGQTLLRQFQK